MRRPAAFPSKFWDRDRRGIAAAGPKSHLRVTYATGEPPQMTTLADLAVGTTSGWRGRRLPGVVEHVRCSAVKWARAVSIARGGGRRL